MAKGGSSFRLSALPVTIFAHLLVISVTILVLFWLLHFQDGFAFESINKEKIFNLHPFLMVVGFLLIAGEAIMSYKSISSKKEVQKVVHLVLHFIALASAIIGLYAVFKFHNDVKISNMYSLHSWIGLSTVILFGLQWLLAFFAFFFPGSESVTKARMAPWHIFFGMVIFLMAIISAETGLMELFTFFQLRHGQQALIMNFTGLLILLFGIAVGLSVILPRTH